MPLFNQHWIGMDGKPITGRVPAQMFVPNGQKLTATQQGAVFHAYKLFCDAINVSALPNGYHVQNRKLADGTTIRMESIAGVQKVFVAPPPPLKKPKPQKPSPLYTGIAVRFIPVISNRYGVNQSGDQVDPDYWGSNSYGYFKIMVKKGATLSEKSIDSGDVWILPMSYPGTDWSTWAKVTDINSEEEKYLISYTEDEYGQHNLIIDGSPLFTPGPPAVPLTNSGGEPNPKFLFVHGYGEPKPGTRAYELRMKGLPFRKGVIFMMQGFVSDEGYIHRLICLRTHKETVPYLDRPGGITITKPNDAWDVVGEWMSYYGTHRTIGLENVEVVSKEYSTDEKKPGTIYTLAKTNSSTGTFSLKLYCPSDVEGLPEVLSSVYEPEAIVQPPPFVPTPDPCGEVTLNYFTATMYTRSSRELYLEYLAGEMPLGQSYLADWKDVSWSVSSNCGGASFGDGPSYEWMTGRIGSWSRLGSADPVSTVPLIVNEQMSVPARAPETKWLDKKGQFVLTETPLGGQQITRVGKLLSWTAADVSLDLKTPYDAERITGGMGASVGAMNINGDFRMKPTEKYFAIGSSLIANGMGNYGVTEPIRVFPPTQEEIDGSPALLENFLNTLDYRDQWPSYVRAIGGNNLNAPPSAFLEGAGSGAEVYTVFTGAIHDPRSGAYLLQYGLEGLVSQERFTNEIDDYYVPGTEVYNGWVKTYIGNENGKIELLPLFRKWLQVWEAPTAAWADGKVIIECAKYTPVGSTMSAFLV